MTYKTSLDKVAKVTTITITILFAAIIIGQILFIPDTGKAMVIFTTITLLAIYFGTFSYRPVHYILSDNQFIIHRPLSNIKIARNEIKSVEQLDKEQLAWTVRIFGVGGLFGYWGKFSNKKIGSMTWYATRKNNAVLIQTIHNEKIIVTPNEPQKFVAEFNG